MTDETEMGDVVCNEADGCPTETAVLKREWRRLSGEVSRLTSENMRLMMVVSNTRSALDAVLSDDPPQGLKVVG